MASLLPQLFLDSGAGLTPSDGALLYFNVVGSGTDKDTYTTAAATVANANPVVADSKGVFPPIYIAGDYDWVLQNKNAVQQNAGTVSELVTSTEITADLLLSSVKPFATLAAAVADTGLVDGDSLNLKERTTGNGGGALWDVVFSSTVTENTYNIVQCTGVGTLSLVLRIDDATLNTAEFGVTASGSVSANTLAAQAALDLAATNGYSVTDTEGTYNFSTLLIKNGTKCVDFTSGTWTPDGNSSPTATTTQAAVVLQGAQTGGTIVTGCKVSMKIDMQNGDRTAILGDGCQECEFTANNIFGFTNDATYNHRGIRLQDDGVSGANRNKVHNNRIVGYSTPTQLGLLIDVWGVPGSDFAGFFTGTITNPTLPALDNLIHDNTLLYGSYAINLQAADGTSVYGNTCRTQNHRSIYVANGSRRNIITNNNLLTFTSSALVLGYGSRDNIFSDNMCVTGIFAGEAAININTGSSRNLITNNYVDSATNYGVYIATDSSFNTVDGNHIKNFYLAGVHVENDIMDTPSTNALYARPNYADPDTVLAGATSWTFNDLEGTIIQNNAFYYGYTGRNTAAISLAQMENTLVGSTLTELKNTTVKNNTVVGMSNIAYCLFVYEFAAGKNSGIRYEGNTFNSAATAIDFLAFNSSGAMDLKDTSVYAAGNDQLDQVIHGNGYTFTDLDTTPSIQYWRFFKCANSGATSITDFDDPYEGKEILIRLDSNTTIVYNTSLIRTISTANITGSSNTFLRFISIGGIWIET